MLGYYKSITDRAVLKATLRHLRKMRLGLFQGINIEDPKESWEHVGLHEMLHASSALEFLMIRVIIS